MTEYSSEFRELHPLNRSDRLTTHALWMIIDIYYVRSEHAPNLSLDNPLILTDKDTGYTGHIQRIQDNHNNIHGFIALCPDDPHTNKTFFMSLIFSEQDISFTGIYNDAVTPPVIPMENTDSIDEWGMRIFERCDWELQEPEDRLPVGYYAPQIRAVSRFLNISFTEDAD